MKRWHDDFKKTRKKWKIGGCRREPGRYRKINPFCNKTGCGICRGHKKPKRQVTLKEIKSDVEFEEEILSLKNYV